MKTANRRTLSLQGLLWLYLAAAVLVFLALGLNLVYRIDEIRTAAASERQELARADLRAAFVNGHQAVHRLAIHLARWDEVAQQLRLPAYYHYWRSNRLPRSRELPDYVRDFDLYDAQGRTLLKRPDSLLPHHVPASRRRFTLRQNTLLHIHFVPVTARGDPATTLGYLGLAVDMLAALRAHHYFSYLDPRSLRVRPFATPTPTPATVLEHMAFEPLNVERDSPLASLLKWQWLLITLLLAVLVGLLYLLLHRFVSRPLGRLIRYVDRLSDHPDRLDEPLHLPDLPLREFVTLKDSLQHYQRELARARHRLDAQNTELLRLAHRDHLTGAWNRLAFDEDWQHLTRMLENQRMTVAFLLFDCDHFKAINDTYGHEIGDRVIAAIALRLQQTLRRGDKLYRLGGDEFATIVLNSDSDNVIQVAERCRAAVAAHPFDKFGIREPVGISIGIAISPDASGGALRELPRQADLAMYHAKKQRQPICVYRESMRGDAAILSSYKVAAVLAAVEKRHNLEVHYQPVFARERRQPVYFEALIRLRGPDDELIRPGDIFPIIERHGLDADFDRAVIAAVVADLDGHHLPAGSGVAVNLSAASLVHPQLETWLADLAPHLAHYRIVLEITETSLIAQLQQATVNLERLQQRGFRIALDDFGSGYSSLRYLANMPVDIVKFDITMIQSLHDSPRSRLIIEHIARLIREAGYDLVAEGIEDQATLDLVYRMGATHAQGYFLGRPEPKVGTRDEEQRLCAASSNAVPQNRKRTHP